MEIMRREGSMQGPKVRCYIRKSPAKGSPNMCISIFMMFNMHVTGTVIAGKRSQIILKQPHCLANDICVYIHTCVCICIYTHMYF